MKKMFLLLVLAVAACTKIPEREQEITIVLSNVESGPLTKVNPASALSASLPTKIPAVTLQSTTIPSRKYTILNGERTVVPIDTYTVTGAYAPTEAGSIQGGKVFTTPPYTINGVINVVENQEAYSVPAAFSCFALVLDTEEVEKYRTRNTAGSLFDIPWMVGDEVKVAYIQGYWEFPAMTLESVPIDIANYETKRYGLVTNKNYEGFLVENGKWYCFGPNGVATKEGAIGIDFPSWIDGN